MTVDKVFIIDETILLVNQDVWLCLSVCRMCYLLLISCKFFKNARTLQERDKDVKRYNPWRLGVIEDCNMLAASLAIITN